MVSSQKKIALVADWITHWGGAERVFVKLMEMYPEAEIYTSVFFPTRPEVFAGRKIHKSFIHYLPFLNRRHKLCMLLRPLAFWSFNFRKYDIVISSSSAEAKGIRTRRIPMNNEKGIMKNVGTSSKNGPVHICYCHTPTRYLWSHSEAYRSFLEFGRLNWLAKLVIPTAFRIMRKWDYRAAQRPDVFIANSCTTQARIAEFYKRESTVVYPFFTPLKPLPSPLSEGEGNGKVESNSLPFGEGKGGVGVRSSRGDLMNKNYFVCLGRIVPYKRFDLAIEACNQMVYKLRIFTNTRNAESERLQKISGPTIEWIFDASDSEVAEGLAHAQAFIMPQEEDFGIVALEAMSHGTPVIAYGDGGAMETVVHGQTGLFFSEQRTGSLVNALLKFPEIEWNPERIIEQSQRFSEERFEREFRQIVSDIL